MTEEGFQKLLDQYLQDPVKQPESQWFHAFIKEMESRAIELSPAEHQRISAEMLRGIKEQLDEKRGLPQALRRNLGWWRAAAAILFLGVIVAFLQLKPYFTTLTVTTQASQQDTILLADGSRVFLNVGSTIKFPQKFWFNERRITLVGEAYFEVKRNPQQPFVVRSGTVETTVLGTSFNILAYHLEDIAVTVITGKVAMSVLGAAKSQALILGNQQSGIFRSKERILQKRQVKDLSETLAWRNGYLAFAETPMRGVMAALERWYGIKVESSSSALRNCKLTGHFTGNNLTQALESICFITNSRWKKEGPRLYSLSGEGCAVK